MRTTTHIGGKGKGSVKHNFREFDIHKSENIDIDRMINNKFLVNGYFCENMNQLAGLIHANQKLFAGLADQFGKNPKFSTLTPMQKIELSQYNYLLKNSIAAQNDRYCSKGQYKYCKDTVDVLLSDKTCPTETILQVGNQNEHVSASVLWDIYKDYINRHSQQFGKCVKILNASLHGDEITPHIHQRTVFIGENKHGDVVVSKTEALKYLGIEAPHPDQKQDRFNNRLMTYTAMCRELWIEVCQEHGIDIETVPTDPQQHGLDLAEYKAACEEKKLYAAQEQLAVLETAVQGKVQQSKALNDRINELSGLYEDDFQQFDIALQICEMVQQEYPGYFEELQDRLNIPTADIELHVDDDELEL